MKNPLIMRVLNAASHFRHQRDASARLVAKGRARIDQATARRELHAKKWEPVLAFAHFVDGEDVWMIETRRRFGFATKTRQRFTRISVVTQNPFQRHDAARMSLPRTINYAHAAASDLFQNLIVAEPPIG